MKIISISLDESTINAINHLIESKGFSGRSEIVRAAVSRLIDEQRENEKLNGEIDAILLINHPEKHTESLMNIRHHYQSLIQTHLHTHLQNHHCLELFILKGSSEKIRKLKESYETSKKVSNVKLIVS